MPDNPDIFDLLGIRTEVADAIQSGRGVVALESTIIAHGMPYPKNVETALKVEDAVRQTGAVPATIAIVNGRMKAGLSADELEVMGKEGSNVSKCSRRDLPFVMNRNQFGATTVAATMIIAAKAGIHIFATGGIGGVHRNGENTMDISADLQELARTDVAVVSAGAKAVLDIGRTLEYLEMLGVPVIGFGTDHFPAFYMRDSGFNVDYRYDDELELAKAIKLKWDAGLNGGLVIANPVPEAYEMEYRSIQQAIEQAITEAEEMVIKGKELTPWLLSRIEEITTGKSLESNIELVLNNAALAGRLAVELAGLSNV